MSKTFKVGDHVSWNSEAGTVSGVIIRKVTSDISYKGYVHHASKKQPQYLIKSDKTDHIAIHKGAALHLIKSRRAGKTRNARGKKLS
jgi:Hypervirulence associated proteins TUDOR domain